MWEGPQYRDRICRSRFRLRLCHRGRPLSRRRRAALIKRVYEVDPLVCPKCGGEMRVIAFIERRQRDVIRKILEHCGLWEEPRAPARAPPTPVQKPLELRYEADPDYTPAPED